ncbi:hypothetical protein [Roseibium sp.]|uniref:hypothetical protein n=1 Tax=Roseibium sp. TaxID=1936156 RepID=UPI0032640C26
MGPKENFILIVQNLSENGCRLVRRPHSDTGFLEPAADPGAQSQRINFIYPSISYRNASAIRLKFKHFLIRPPSLPRQPWLAKAPLITKNDINHMILKGIFIIHTQRT